MRPVPFALTAALLVGCSAEPSSFDHQAALSVDARGVALSEDGTRGQVGMFSTTCAVDTHTSAIGADVDVDDSDEDVHDAGSVDDRSVVIVSGDDGLYSFDANNPLEMPALELPGTFFDARTFDSGVVGVGGQALVWSNGGEFPIGALTGFDVSRDGVAYVADGDVRAVTPDGSEWLASGDRVAVDGTSGLLFVGFAGESELRIVDLSGVEQGRVDLGGDLRQVVTLGDRGEVVAVVARDNGTGELLVVDGEGGIRTSVVTPSPAQEITSSANGRTIAAKVPGALHFFGVR